MPATTDDFYTILGVERTAGADEIKRAFRRKARELHPDVNPAPDAEERFKELNQAYDVLSDADKRDQYDRFGSVGRGPANGAGGGYQYVDFGDIFGGGGGGGFDMGDLFSAFFGGVGGGRGGVRLEGRDMSTTVHISLEEAATGVTKEIVVDRLATCDVCGGTGAEEDSDVTTCPDCGGTGQRVAVRRTFIGAMQTAVPCERCGATGKIVEHPCDECQGSGRVPDRQHVNVDIPAGIHHGQQIRLSGLGEAGIRGADSGDLLVTVRVASHEFLHREGDDLHCRSTISITQAALGAEIVVPGLLDDEHISVPAGSHEGDTVRLKGHGVIRRGTTSRGDLYVHLAIAVPKKLTKRQRELLEELAGEFGDSVSGEKGALQRLKDWLKG